MPVERMIVACAHCGAHLADGEMPRAYATIVLKRHFEGNRNCAKIEEAQNKEGVQADHIRLLQGPAIT